MADHTEITQITQKMKSAAATLHTLAPKVGKARAVREYSGDRRHRLLAIEIENVKEIEPTVKMNAAEQIARASKSYGEELDKLEAQFADAETVIAQFTAAQATMEVARSILSMEKVTMDILKG